MLNYVRGLGLKMLTLLGGIVFLYCLALIISINSGLSDAAPTKNPSRSGCFARFLQLLIFTEPEKIEVKQLHTYDCRAFGTVTCSY